MKWSAAFKVLTVVGAKQDNSVTALIPGKAIRRTGLLLWEKPFYSPPQHIFSTLSQQYPQGVGAPHT